MSLLYFGSENEQSDGSKLMQWTINPMRENAVLEASWSNLSASRAPLRAMRSFRSGEEYIPLQQVLLKPNFYAYS